MISLFRHKRMNLSGKFGASWFSVLPFTWKVRIGAWLFGKRARKKLYDKLALLITHQVPLSSAMHSISRRKEESDPGSAEAFVLHQIAEGIKRRGNLTDAIKPFVPVMDTVLIASGEGASKLDLCLGIASDMIARGGKVQKVIMKSVATPLVLLLALLWLLWMFGTQLFPAFEEQLPLELWPDTARVLYVLGQFLDTYWHVSLIAILILMGIVKWTMPNYTGRFRIRLDTIPPWSLYRIMHGASWLMAYSALVSAGRQGKMALQDILAQSGKNKWLYQRTLAVLNGFSSNKKSIALAIKTPYNFPDKELVLDLQDYAPLPNINEIIGKIGFEWIEEAVALVELQSSILNRVAFLLVAIFIYATVQSFFGILAIINQMTSQSGIL